MLIKSFKNNIFAIFPWEGKGQLQEFSVQFLLLVTPWGKKDDDQNLLENMRMVNLLLDTLMLFTR